MSLFDASVERLRARVGSFHADLALWIERTSPPGDLAVHNSQLVRLRDYLGGTLGAVVRGTPVDPDTAPPFTGTIDDIPRLRRGVGSVHLLWDFFRDKLAQRDMDAFAAHLGAADDLAWACYEPFLQAATEAEAPVVAAAEVREPPLVFYSTDRTPFAQARTKTLHPPGLDAKDLQFFAAALQGLPVPVIGMPWDIANRMPETTLIGHETGHVIAEDLRLAEEARTAVRQAEFAGDADGVRKSVWEKWCDEIFADVIGVLATGGAFVEGLTVELAGERTETRLAPITKDRPGRYPTPMLRVAFCAELLRRVGVTAPAAWAETYGPIVGASREFADDPPVVAAALLDRSWAALGGRKLPDVLPWTAQREADARAVGERALHDLPATVPFDVRLWVAGAMHAYRGDPRRYTENGLDRTLAQTIVEQRTAGVRSSRGPREALLPFDAPHSADQTRDADRTAGADLARRLGLA
jgi:hypothetical protein